MLRPALLRLASRLPGGTRITPGTLTLGLIALVGLGVGYLGQESWSVGVATPPTVGVVVTDVVGGAGTRQPVRVSISLAVTNLGADQVRVLEADTNGDGADILTLAPADLRVNPGAIGRIDADVTLDCDRPEALELPDLRLQLRDGVRQGFPIGGSGMLLEACGRAVPEVRPLAAVVVPPPVTATADDGQLALRLSSPTGRRQRLEAIRAGGVTLRTAPAAPTVSGRSEVVLRLSAPDGCPTAWQLAGVPSALSVDLRPDPTTPTGTPFSATIALPLGPPLTAWLLAHTCPAPT